MEIIQIVLGNFVQPKMMEKSLNISPITVLLVLAFWGGIWGIIGMILAVTLASITMIILAQFPETHFWAVIMSGNGGNWRRSMNINY